LSNKDKHTYILVEYIQVCMPAWAYQLTDWPTDHPHTNKSHSGFDFLRSRCIYNYLSLSVGHYLVSQTYGNMGNGVYTFESIWHVLVLLSDWHICIRYTGRRQAQHVFSVAVSLF
jgi:hypothetical protein